MRARVTKVRRRLEESRKNGEGGERARLTRRRRRSVSMAGGDVAERESAKKDRWENARRNGWRAAEVRSV